MSLSSFTIDHINNTIISVICGLRDRPEVAASPFRRRPRFAAPKIKGAEVIRRSISGMSPYRLQL